MIQKVIREIIKILKIENLEYLIYKLFRNYYTNSTIKIDISSFENFLRAKTLITKEEDTIAWIDSFNKNDVFYDIGANIGVYSLYASKKCKNVLSFEPHFMNYDVLNKNIYLNNYLNISAFCVAFSNRFEIGSLEHYKFSIGSSTSQFNKTTDHMGKEFNPSFSQGMISLSVDEFVSKIDDRFFPNHIKIDVDGLEEFILIGMNGVLVDNRLKTILVEITEIDDNKDNINNMLLSSNFHCTNRLNTSKHTANYIFKKQELK